MRNKCGDWHGKQCAVVSSILYIHPLTNQLKLIPPIFKKIQSIISSFKIIYCMQQIALVVKRLFLELQFPQLLSVALFSHHTPISQTKLFHFHPDHQSQLSQVLLAPKDGKQKLIHIENEHGEVLATTSIVLETIPIQNLIEMPLSCKFDELAGIEIIASHAQQSLIHSQRSIRPSSIKVKEIILEMVKLKTQEDFLTRQNASLSNQIHKRDQTITELLTANKTISDQLSFYKRISARISRHLRLPLDLTPEHEQMIASKLPHLKLEEVKINHLKGQVSRLTAHNQVLSQNLLQQQEQNALKERVRWLEGQLKESNKSYEDLEKDFLDYEKQSDFYYYQLQQKAEAMQRRQQQITKELKTSSHERNNLQSNNHAMLDLISQLTNLFNGFLQNLQNIQLAETLIEELTKLAIDFSQQLRQNQQRMQRAALGSRLEYLPGLRLGGMEWQKSLEKVLKKS